MTFKAAKLLKRLKTAQMHPDSEIIIDFEDLTAGTFHIEGETYQEVSLKGFEHSIISTLDHLRDRDYIDYDRETGFAVVTHAGWNATSMTVRSAIQFTFRDVIVPITVSVIGTIVTAILMQTP